MAVNTPLGDCYTTDLKQNLIPRCSVPLYQEKNLATLEIMAVNDQRLPAGTIVQSPLSMKLPTVDVTTYVFSRPADEKEAPLYFNPESPSQNYSLREAEVYVKRIAKGLQNFGLQKGDRVLLYAGNKLFFPIVLWSTIAAGCVFTGSSPAATATGLSPQGCDRCLKII